GTRVYVRLFSRLLFLALTLLFSPRPRFPSTRHQLTGKRIAQGCFLLQFKLKLSVVRKPNSRSQAKLAKAHKMPETGEDLPYLFLQARFPIHLIFASGSDQSLAAFSSFSRTSS
ncbi:hypothetical protein DFH09DRAFT_1170154, partial [Mycena vulgaris]